MSIPYLACMLAVANAQHLPPRVLPSIQAVEGGAIGTASRNRDGSEDFGVMQVNTRWLPALARYTGRDETTVRQALLNNACFNIAVAGAILRLYISETGGNLLAAIGDYHSHTPMRNQTYQTQVIGAAFALFGSRARRSQ
jgi:soluble lytic murein transglycosylase-like protein